MTLVTGFAAMSLFVSLNLLTSNLMVMTYLPVLSSPNSLATSEPTVAVKEAPIFPFGRLAATGVEPEDGGNSTLVTSVLSLLPGVLFELSQVISACRMVMSNEELLSSGKVTRGTSVELVYLSVTDGEVMTSNGQVMVVSRT